MHDVNLAALAASDLNLLVALRALLVERHVTRAAARVGLSQPAMSHALGRLRELLGDPLLVRTKDGLVPTARAAEIAEPLERVMDDVARVLARPEPFDPSTAERSFRIGTGDYTELVLLPPLLARIRDEAPGVDLRIVNASGDVAPSLSSGKVDLAILPATAMRGARSMRMQKLFDEDFVCVVRADHPRVGKRLTLETFVALPHALVSPSGEPGSFVDTALAKLGRTRRVAVEIPHFLVAPYVVQRTDVVLTLAGRLARALGPSLGLRLLAPPIDVEGFTMAMFWHERTHADPAHAWLRSVIAAVAKKT